MSRVKFDPDWSIVELFRKRNAIGEVIKDLGKTDFIGVIKKRINMKCYSDYKNG